MRIKPTLLLPAALVLAPAHAAGQALADPAGSLIRLADANGDGDVAATEWAAFLTSLETAGDGSLNARQVLARLAFTDQNGDGSFGISDVGVALDSSPGSGLAPFFLQALADANGDGEMSQEERAAFFGALPAQIDEAQTIAWIASVEALPPPPEDDRGRRVPPVVLASMVPALDADKNGTLTAADLNGLHRGADSNGDGVVEAQELAIRQGPTFTRWIVDQSVSIQPPLMPWQRTLDDALLLVERTRKPLLICVNMDNENASEVLAWNLYRRPEFAALADGFVCVLASPDRREPRERDDRGRRLPDRRFGRLLNSEHIDIDPLLFEDYFSGQRVAPRHVGVSPDGEILFDLYLLQNLSIIEDKLREFGKPVPTAADPIAMSIAELMASPAASHREELERRFLAADPATRVQLVGQAYGDGPVHHPELVHLALRDEEPEVRLAATNQLTLAPSRFPAGLVPEAFIALADYGDADAQAKALAGLRAGLAAAEAAGDERRTRDMRFYVDVYSALGEPSRHLAPERWRVLLTGEAKRPAVDYAAIDFDATLQQLEAVENALSGSDDVAFYTRRMEVLAKLARIRMATGENPLYFLQDVERAADDVIVRAPFHGRALAYKAWSLFQLNKMAASGEAAALALPHLAGDAGDPLTFEVLNIFATAKTREIYDAVGSFSPWGDEALPDALAAYAVIGMHPEATEAHWVRRLEFLATLRIYHLQHDVIREALAAFPVSESLHPWLRFLELRDYGARSLEAAYDEPPLADAAAGYETTLLWQRGLATLFAAEHDVKNRDLTEALAAYGRSGARFQESADAEPTFAGSVAHYSALLLSGIARIELQAGRLDEAANSAARALREAPGSAAQRDGLGQSPIETANEVLARLEAAGLAEKAAAVRAAAQESGVDLAGGR